MHRPNIAMAQAAATQASACAATMRFPLRQMVWRGSAGEMAGTGSGSSMDFQDHRSYLPGDDPRHINWAAYSRTGNYTLKVYREEVSPTVEILMDASPSMFLDEDKARLSCELLAFALEAAKRDGATTLIHLLGKQEHRQLTEEEVVSGQWVSRIEEKPPGGAEAPSAPPLAHIPFRTGSLRVLLSDLLFASPPHECLRALLRNRGCGIILAPYSKSESQPDWNGICDFRDVESAVIESKDANAGLLKRYLQAYRSHFSAWKEEAVRHQMALARIAAGSPLREALGGEAMSSRALKPST